MYHSTMNAAVALAILATTPFATAQNTGGITANFPCAKVCIDNLLASPTCNPNHVALPNASCICTNSDLIDEVSCCIAQLCDSADQAKALAFADSICGSVTNNVIPKAAGCSGAAAANSAAATSVLASGSTAASVMSTTSTASSSMSTTTNASAIKSVSTNTATSDTATSNSSAVRSVSSDASTAVTAASSAASTAASSGFAVKPTAAIGGAVLGGVVGLAGILL